MLLGEDECITPMEGIRAYTINAAYAAFEENSKGSITAGKLADLVVLGDNPLTVGSVGDPQHPGGADHRGGRGGVW